MKSATRYEVDCADCPIRHRAVCASCDTGELARLEAIKFYRSFEPGQSIGLRGDDMETIASVVHGTATLTRGLEDGRTQMVGLLLPSDFIGRPGRSMLPYDVTAVSAVTLCCFKRGPFEELVVQTPHLGERMLKMALDELDAARDWMLLLGRKTAREKVASFLLLIYRRTIRPGGEHLGENMCLELPITREVMASYLGLTIETVSRQLTAMRKAGVIQIEGKRRIIITDFEALLIESGDDDDGIFLS